VRVGDPAVPAQTRHLHVGDEAGSVVQSARAYELWAQANVAVLYPSDLTRHSVASRIDLSSSTIEIMGTSATNFS